jgi:hypothetical protein
LTWKVSNFEKDELIIQINFSDPLIISPKIDQDEIVLHFKEPQNYFISEANKNLSYEFHILKHNIRKQMIKSNEAETFLKYSNTGGYAY